MSRGLQAGYDGWRLDYVRGFWGGYVKNYMVRPAHVHSYTVNDDEFPCLGILHDAFDVASVTVQ